MSRDGDCIESISPASTMSFSNTPWCLNSDLYLRLELAWQTREITRDTCANSIVTLLVDRTWARFRTCGPKSDIVEIWLGTLHAFSYMTFNIFVAGARSVHHNCKNKMVKYIYHDVTRLGCVDAARIHHRTEQSDRIVQQTRTQNVNSNFC
jgi:hypothetical protein